MTSTGTISITQSRLLLPPDIPVPLLRSSLRWQIRELGWLPVPVHGPRAPSSTASGIETGNRPGTSPGVTDRPNPAGWESLLRPLSATAPPAEPIPPLTRVPKCHMHAAFKGQEGTGSRDRSGIRELVALQSSACLEAAGSGLAVLLTHCHFEIKTNCPSSLDFFFFFF